MAEWLCVPSGKRLNVGSSPTVGAVFSAMKAEYVVVAEQVHPLAPAYSFPHIVFTDVGIWGYVASVPRPSPLRVIFLFFKSGRPGMKHHVRDDVSARPVDLA